MGDKGTDKKLTGFMIQKWAVLSNNVLQGNQIIRLHFAFFNFRQHIGTSGNISGPFAM